ncbi:MAG: hypothetical protein C0616_07005, partial [Desulfuromonas sp.]
MKPQPGSHRLVEAAHRWLRPVLSPGALAVDLTAGNGHDTLFLARQVDSGGTVIAFDIQKQALDNSAERLSQAGFPVQRDHAGRCPVTRPGIHLVHDGHQFLPEYLNAPSDAVIANLGYLPGGDKQITTRAETTRRALDSALNALWPQGRLAVVV